MIVRVQGSGQFRLGDRDVAALDHLDQDLLVAVQAKDEVRTHQLLDEMIALVRGGGEPIRADELLASDAVLPYDTITVEEVRTLLQHKSLAGAAQPAT